MLLAKSNVLELNVQVLHWFDELSELVIVQISVSVPEHSSTSYNFVVTEPVAAVSLYVDQSVVHAGVFDVPLP